MYNYIKNDNLLTCVLSGKIDTLNSEMLEYQIFKNMSQGITSVVFDLQDVDYVSSSFLRIIIKIIKTTGKENFTIKNVQPPILKILKIANFTEIVKIE
jgi:anti-sigma B factor antagonist